MVPDTRTQTIARSFQCAGEGIINLLRTERNFRIDLGAAILVGFMACLTRTRGVDLAVILALIGIMLASEAFNAALESAVDLVSSDFHVLAKRAKDIAAGGVLLMAFVSVIVGALIFLPKLALLTSGYLSLSEAQAAWLALFAAAFFLFCAWCITHPLSVRDEDVSEQKDLPKEGESR
ncbi:MAG: diacylglycerol kinase family protein [Coriobacteriia bacterium]|nr:diacylglycerol kinase family protein [Coriobacteriia bacterium]